MLYVSILLVLVIFVYYYIFVVQRPYLYIKSELISKFFERCRSPTSTVWPTPFLYRTGVLQTLFGATVRGAAGPLEDVPHERESVKNDVALDWVTSSSSGALGVLVILNHGYGGRLVHGLIRDLARKSIHRHMHTVVVSIAGIESLSLNLNSTLQAALAKVEERVGSHVPKVLVAFSLGGIPALKFAIHQGCFAAMALVSVPLDEMTRGSMARSSAASNLMLATAKEVVKTHADVATAKWPDLVSRAIEAGSLSEFHGKFISIAFDQGEVNLTNILEQITCPCIFFYALDDPFIDFASVDLVKVVRKAEVATVVVEQGGHCGFFAGLRGRDRWVSDYALDFLVAAITPTS